MTDIIKMMIPVRAAADQSWFSTGTQTRMNKNKQSLTFNKNGLTFFTQRTAERDEG